MRRARVVLWVWLIIRWGAKGVKCICEWMCVFTVRGRRAQLMVRRWVAGKTFKLHHADDDEASRAKLWLWFHEFALIVVAFVWSAVPLCALCPRQRALKGQTREGGLGQTRIVQNAHTSTKRTELWICAKMCAEGNVLGQRDFLLMCIELVVSIPFCWLSLRANSARQRSSFPCV